MTHDPIHLVYGTDDNYFYPTAISAASAAFYTRSSQLIVHLFDLGVMDKHYEQFCALVKRAGNPNVEFVRHQLPLSLFEGFGAWKGSIATYSRMLIAEIMQEEEWAIYVDGDTLWLGDLAELWALRDDTKLILASIDPPTPSGVISPEFAWYRERGIEIDPKDYLCMGLMLANLRRMREEKVGERCKAFMKDYPCPRVVDQTVLNYVCHGKTAPLPKQWGVFSAWHGGIDFTQPSMVHYVTDVPWNRAKLNRLFSDVAMLWFDFCKNVLGEDNLSKFSWWTRFWKRAVFLVLKYNQWILAIHPYLKAHLRNTHGIPSKDYRLIVQRWKK